MFPTIVTISWNNLQHTKNFIESLKCIRFPFNLMIWDNGSSDSTWGYIKDLSACAISPASYCYSYLPLRSEKNYGLPLVWNIGLRWMNSIQDMDGVKSDCAFLANNDIKFNLTINNIEKFIDHNPQAGMITPLIFGRDHEQDHEEHAKTLISKEVIDGLNGPLQIIPKTAFEVVGPYDEDLPFSFEDCDYYNMAKKCGFETLIYKGTALWHHGGASTCRTPKEVSAKCYEHFSRKHA